MAIKQSCVWLCLCVGVATYQSGGKELGKHLFGGEVLPVWWKETR